MAEENNNITEPTFPENHGYTVLNSEDADISEYQSVSSNMGASERQTVSIEDRLVSLHALSKIVLSVGIVLCLLVFVDGYSKSSSSGNVITSLPFFQQWNFFCNRTNGGTDLDFVLKDTKFLAHSGKQDMRTQYDNGVCFTRKQLGEVYEEFTKYHQDIIAQALKEVLPRKFSYVSFSESPLFRFVQSKSPDRRVNHSEVIQSILEQVDTITNQADTQLICQKVVFEEKVARVSCIARGKSDVTSRDVVLKFFDQVKKQSNLLIVNHPDSIELRELEKEEFETETVFELQVIERKSDYENELLNIIE